MSNHWADMGDEGQITAAETGDPYFAHRQMAAGQTAEISVNRTAFIEKLGQRNRLAKELDAIKHEIAEIKYANYDEPTVILITIDTGEDGGNGAYANFGAEMVGSTLDPEDAVTAALFFTANKLQNATGPNLAPSDIIAFQTAYNYYANQTGAQEIPTDGIFGKTTSALYVTVVSSPKFAGWVSGTFGYEGQINAAQMGDPNFARNQLATGNVQQIEVNQRAFRNLFTQIHQLHYAIHAANTEKNQLINEIH